MATHTLGSTDFLRRFRKHLTKMGSRVRVGNVTHAYWSPTLAAFCSMALVLSGCGGGGYPGGGISSLSASSIVMDAGQSIAITATVSGNYAPSWAMAGASCSGATCGTLSVTTGDVVTYVAPSGISAPVQLTLTASIAGTANKQTVSITVNPDPAFSGTPPVGVVGAAYSTTISLNGGTAPVTASLSAGSVPPGLAYDPTTGKITGTPTTTGTFPFTLQAVDSSVVPFTVTANESITVVNPPAALILSGGPPPEGEVGIHYTTSFTASGGVTPYAWSVSSGSLPAGLSISATTGIISGIPTVPGTSSFTVQVEDATNATASELTAITIVSPLSLTGGPQPNGIVGTAYTTSLEASGGVTPYAWSVISGSLPGGLSISPTTGAITGIPTAAGTFSFTVRVQDSLGSVATAAASITIIPQLAIASVLPGGQVGVAYGSTITATGGVTPYACSISAGTLPAGLSLTGCVVSGTPTAAGSSTITVHVTDSGAPQQNASSNQTILVAPATLIITSTLPNGTVGVVYSSNITATGGTTPYACSISSGTLPAGIVLTGCTVSGTPTVAGSSAVTVTVTDAGSPIQTANSNQTILIGDAALTLTTTTMPDGTVGIPYSAQVGVSGGMSPYSCTITAGLLPGGLTLTGCTVSGTPTTAGPSTVTVHVTDSQNPSQSATGPETIVINPAALTITSTLPNGTVGVSYSSTITASGGTTPYSCTISGALPAGLALTGCTVSGIPTSPGSSTVTVTVTDSSSPTKTTSQQQTIVINPSGTLSLTGTLPIGTVGVPYTYTLIATGGTPSYTYALTAGSLPPGISLASDGTISGTPTQPGATSFTVTVTDSASPAATASLPLILLIEYAPGPNDGELSGPYAYLFQGYDDVVSGVLAYQTATVGSFTADGSGGINFGELDANHQSSNPIGTTVPTQNFLGTYVVNSDNRGYITITTLNSDGTTDQTFTYAISLKAPVSPSTISTQGSLIEFDNNEAVGTKGSGTLLAQTPADFTAGLDGHYVFGLSGDTPCLISCTVGIASGPVATVGVFGTDGAGSVNSGTADANVASLNFANAPLTGSYQSTDANGRLNLQLTNTSISDGLYPTDYAVYMVNANQFFVMSTDKHSAYTLLAGTGRVQSGSSFSNASMNSAIIGYENAQVDAGLLGVTLQNVLNYSQATVFRASGNGAGTCNTTNVDSGGLTSLVNSLSSLTLTEKNNLLSALLGDYDPTGTSACTVSSTGRGTLNYPGHSSLITLLLGLLGLPSGPPAPRVFYLASPNTGYFLETGYAGLGQFEPQTGAPFSLATLDGTYAVDNVPASSLAGINSTGNYTFDGAGNASYTLDENVGVGTTNALQLDVTGATTYSLTDSNNNVTAATAGRYVLGDTMTVIYAISPGRFVEIDTNPLNTSPSISLLF
jgi:large repetitive protein